MAERNINRVLADNLERQMDRRKWDKNKLSAASGIAPRTIGYYLRPEHQQVGSKGKEPSAKLSEVQLLAQALEIETWQLLRDLTAEQWAAYEKIEAAFFDLQPKRPPDANGDRKAA